VSAAGRGAAGAGSVFLVRGPEPVLREKAVAELLAELVGDDDRSLAVEELTVPGRGGDGTGTGASGGAPGGDAGTGGDDAPAAGGSEGRASVVGAACNAALSPPFMTARRIVVVRDVENLTGAESEPLAAYLADPMPTTVLVFVSGGGRLPAPLAKAWKGLVVERGGESGATLDVVGREVEAAGIRLRNDAARAMAERLGDDAGRVPALVELLAATFGTGRTITAADVEPYLGAEGSVPVYLLSNAVDAGDTASALEVLQRMLHATTSRQARAMHPLQVLSLLHNHYRRLLRLDDPAVRTDDDAVGALGGKVKKYPARKALEQARALGTDGLRRAVDLLAGADGALKGATGVPEEAVVEVLVARLCALSRSAGTAPAGGGASRAGTRGRRR